MPKHLYSSFSIKQKRLKKHPKPENPEFKRNRRDST